MSKENATQPATEPMVLSTALASFEALWSPRIVTRVNDYDVRVAKVSGEHVWHVHEDTDEFFLVLDGTLDIALRDGDGDGQAGGSGGDGERSVTLEQGAVFVVPRGVWHLPRSGRGASILLFEPSGTSTVGDAHDAVPGHVDVTTGHALGA
ncbi:cupin domain-containing protein [Streptomyces sp. SM11]|uniref:cupin domain-containing protein n=1 Tax=Streptomyces sp. SM11 TaxID=565557 RepID=UPI000CD58422|nr:cupin domain-containing protein [Streptomyces sp. SM11]